MIPIPIWTTCLMASPEYPTLAFTSNWRLSLSVSRIVTRSPPRLTCKPLTALSSASSSVLPEAVAVVIWCRSLCCERCSCVSANSSALTTAMANWSARIWSERRFSSVNEKGVVLCTSSMPKIRSPIFKGIAVSARVSGSSALGRNAAKCI